MSGLQISVGPDDYLHYRKFFTLPSTFGDGRILLHFGAVDQECWVTLNGKRLGEHVGGYLPFQFDITEAVVEGENILEVCVRDRTEFAPYARGKQKLNKRGKFASIFYTPTSGIWKTVWLENVPKNYITDVHFTPRYDEAQVEVEVNANASGPVEITFSLGEQQVYHGSVAANAITQIDLPDFLPWSPEHPHLYDVQLKFGEDKVTSYFGMRCFGMVRDAKGILRFTLNNKPYFFNGLLDQAYWPDGLLTAPSEEAIKHDILTMKKMGYNTLRMHVKVEEENFYALCDRIGMIVWQDMPNGGGDYDMFFVTILPNVFNWFGRGVKDHWYHAFRRADKVGRQQYYEELTDMISLLDFYPCIALWTPFNEGWGQFDAQKATELIRSLDATRLINEACGWFDQGGGDLYSIHNYRYKLKVSPKQNRVVALTEYGGYAFAAPEHTACEKEFGYQTYKSSEGLTANYRRLWEEEILPNVPRGLSAAIYTQVSDIEEEINGLLTYDREMVKMNADEVCRLNERLYTCFEEAVSDR